MKPLESETNLLEAPDAVDAIEIADSVDTVDSIDASAALLSDVVPLVNRTIRAQMRSHRGEDLSIPQFRTLLFLRRHPGASLSDVAEHIGLTLPSISKMIVRLEARDLVVRHGAPHDRRRICLELTDLGKSTLRAASDATRDHLSEKLALLTPEERAVLVQALHSLRSVFGTDNP